ncbi:MAG: phosphopantothenoylcysteine decarboxylase / phosphopantothenate---cysteine ligase [Chloroflexota bacterium]|jgi:phosphopantothenoylcysteine decarboxylase/phosphopantothenate--cysteine ligase|nr:phosphopantothenoylcysteine decarboxylase / phosphopantothenate---cysteine ligase [Chloroflexota bacterium]
MNAHLARRAFSGRRLLVAVCGGVAAYKVAETVSLLVQAGAEVRVAMTPEATHFIAPLTFEALSGQPVASDLFGRQTAAGRDGGEMHIALSDWPEAILVMPATANFVAKLAHGLADEVVSTTLLASAAPLVLAPAMHSRMWQQEATQLNVETLRGRGVSFAGPVEGRLASGEVGMGRLADQEEVLRALRGALPGIRDMEGLGVLVSAGGTREALDPVRYIGNRSSGLMGHALAAAAEARGARVTLVTTSKLAPPRGVELVAVDSAAEMAEALRSRADATDILVMAAAVADFRPRHRADHKMPKGEVPTSLELELNEDIVASMDPAAGGRLVKVGFAAETRDLLARAQEKLMSKRLDLVVANDVSDPSIGMGSLDNAVTIIGRDGTRRHVDRAPKEDIGHEILSAALEVLRAGRAGEKAS